MKYSAAIVAASAAAIAAQTSLAGGEIIYNASNATYTCVGNPNGAYCAGDSLTTNIIIRCTNGVGQPGNCNDNLSGYFPYGVRYAECFQTSVTSGDAACAKNCIIEGSSGNFPGTSTLSDCTPTPTPSSTSASASASVIGKPSNSTLSDSITITSTGVKTFVDGTSTIIETFTTTYCPASASLKTIQTAPGIPIVTPKQSGYAPGGPIATGGSTVVIPSTNGTLPTTVAGGSTPGQSATATPVGPSATPSTILSSGAIANGAGFSLAALGIFVAYFL